MKNLHVTSLHWVIIGTVMTERGCGLVHKPLAYHARAQRSFLCGDIAASQTAKQMANKGYTKVSIKSGASKWTFHDPQR